MNVTGMGQYSRETAPIKDPYGLDRDYAGKNLQHKLIFIYPILYADKIRVPNVQSFNNLIRDFISITFLSDMFVQNLFSVIGTANQIRPLWDEKNQSVDPSTGILRVIAAQQGINYYGGGNSMPNYPVSSEHSYGVQQKIQQKTAIIQRLLKTDPKMSKLRPYVETITLGNMIDVPVIVGTSEQQIDTLTLTYVLIAAIGLSRKLTSEADIDVIFSELGRMDKKKYWSLLNNLITTPQEHKTWLEIVQDKSLTVLQKVGGWTGNKGLRRFVPTALSGAAANQASKLQHHIAHPTELDDPHNRFAPLLLNQDELDKTKLYFKFVLNQTLTFNRYGIDTGNEAAKLKNERVEFAGSLAQIKKVIISNFATEIATIGSVMLGSISNLISTDSPSYDDATLKSRYIDHDMVDELIDDKGKFGEIFKAIENGIAGGTVEDARQKIKQMKQFSSINTAGYLKELSQDIADNSIMSRDFGIDQWRNFINNFDELVRTSDSISARLENELEYLTLETEKQAVMTRLQLIQQSISKSIGNFFGSFKTDLTNATPIRLAVLFNKSDNTVITQQLIPKFESGLSKIFYAILLSKLQQALSEYSSVADNRLEMIKNEVTAWPNYTLVLPVEVVLALHAALMGTSWQHMLKGGQEGVSLITKNTLTQKINTPISKKDQVSSMSNVSDSYIKPAIKYIHNRLEVPNLIVVDAKKGDIYYKLMNQTDVNKTKITTIETFIDSKVNHQITQSY